MGDRTGLYPSIVRGRTGARSALGASTFEHTLCAFSTSAHDTFLVARRLAGPHEVKTTDESGEACGLCQSHRFFVPCGARSANW
jgi:hypothetical protein